MFTLAERRHKRNVQREYHPHFCKAEIALLQHLSQQFPKSVFGSPETHGSGSWSHVWLQHSAAGIKCFGLAAWRRLGTSPMGAECGRAAEHHVLVLSVQLLLKSRAGTSARQ